jgi:hypothetical protein
MDSRLKIPAGIPVLANTDTPLSSKCLTVSRGSALSKIGASLFSSASLAVETFRTLAFASDLG